MLSFLVSLHCLKPYHTHDLSICILEHHSIIIVAVVVVVMNIFVSKSTFTGNRAQDSLVFVTLVPVTPSPKQTVLFPAQPLVHSACFPSHRKRLHRESSAGHFLWLLAFTSVIFCSKQVTSVLEPFFYHA